MIAVWMLYGLGIGLAFVVVGYTLEKGLHFAGQPTRWAWVVALAGSYVIPLVAWLRPEAFATFPVPAAPVLPPSSATTSTAAAIFNQTSSAPFSLGDLDVPLRWAWILVSCAMFIALAVAAARLTSLRRRWRRSVVDGHEVLISSDTGPAVVGLWSPRVVLPEWTLTLPAQERELMLAHEEQHLRARDPVLLAAAFGTVFVAPWNLALWWVWRRLRLAVEMDCDARVLAQGRSAPAYGELLIGVSQRRSPRLLGVAAFGEPKSFLEARIRRMVARMPRWRWVGAAAAVIVAVGTVIVACQAPHPLAPAESSASAQRARDLSDRFSVQNAERLLPLIESSARRMFPSILERSGPPVDAFLVADAHLQVYRGTLTTLNYLGNNGARPNHPIDVAELKQALPSFEPGQDGWLIVDSRALEGLVRDNVRVIWINHDPARQDSLETQRTNMSAELEKARRHADFIRQLARQAAPEVLAHPTTNAAIGVVFDAQYHVLALAVGVRKSTDQSCLDALKRLLPRFQNTPFPTAGCMDADTQGKVALYWGQFPSR